MSADKSEPRKHASDALRTVIVKVVDFCTRHACVSRIRSFSTTQLTSGSIVSRPGNGTLSQIGALQFRYAPKKGIKGVDRYSIRICGTSPAGSGCATATYNMTVE